MEQERNAEASLLRRTVPPRFQGAVSSLVVAKHLGFSPSCKHRAAATDGGHRYAKDILGQPQQSCKSKISTHDQ